MPFEEELVVVVVDVFDLEAEVGEAFVPLIIVLKWNLFPNRISTLFFEGELLRLGLGEGLLFLEL
uniref:Uncharacterized protein n=1 Tax=Romanomermis culicivorax TaxID=13658 RepID=A0A915JYE1_ROMCU